MKVFAEQYRDMSVRDIRRLLPKREAESHKGNYGRVLMLCGSTGCSGAA